MSVNTNIYVGPYLRIPAGKKTILKKDIMACSTKRCPHYGQETSTKFCGLCGSNIAKMNVKEKVDLDASTMWSMLDEKFGDVGLYNTDSMSTGGEVLLPSGDWPSADLFDTEAIESEGLDFSTEKSMSQIIEKDINWFNSKFRKELVFIGEMVGEKNIKVCWGVHQWYN